MVKNQRVDEMSYIRAGHKLYDFEGEGQYYVYSDGTKVVDYGETYEEISAEIVTIPKTESNIDLSQYIYEYINLMLPIKKVHPDDEDGNSTCNKEMTDRLNKYSEQKSDPRWDALKDIKLD